MVRPRSDVMDSTALIAIISSVVAFLSSIGVVLIANFFARRKTESESHSLEANATKTLADADTTIATAWKDYAKDIKKDLECEIDKLRAAQEKQQKEIDVLKKDNESQKEMITYYLDGIKRLIVQINNLKAEPIWQPHEDQRKGGDRRKDEE